MLEVMFQEYQARKIVNVHRHVDAWFWDKYTAMPYVGFSSGEEGLRTLSGVGHSLAGKIAAWLRENARTEKGKRGG